MKLYRKPRFECDVCGRDEETFTCGYCVLKACQSCLGNHESTCRIRCEGVKREPGKGFVVLG